MQEFMRKNKQTANKNNKRKTNAVLVKHLQETKQFNMNQIFADITEKKSSRMILKYNIVETHTNI